MEEVSSNMIFSVFLSVAQRLRLSSQLSISSVRFLPLQLLSKALIKRTSLPEGVTVGGNGICLASSTHTI